MLTRARSIVAIVLVVLADCRQVDVIARVADGDARDLPTLDAPTSEHSRDGGLYTCRDSDGDGISDLLEGAPLRHTSLRPDAPADYRNPDSDDDGVSDADEAERRYPHYEGSASPALSCGDAPDDCDGDGLSNYVDRDSDGDGVPDRTEVRELYTDPCAMDTDGDGASDLIELAAGSNPISASSRPPTGTLYVTLPYLDPRGVQHVTFDFSTRIRAADVVFLIDSTASMGSTIEALRSTLTSVIVPGISRALPPDADLRFAVGDFRSFPMEPDGGHGDWVLWMRQPLTRNVALVNDAIAAMSAGGGGDSAECATEAIYQTISGAGQPGHESDPTPRTGPSGGMGFAGRVDIALECSPRPGDPPTFGWACFQAGRVPIIVLFSDAEWQFNRADLCGDFGTPCSRFGMPGVSFERMIAALNERSAYFVGVDVGIGLSDANAVVVATRTNTVDAGGRPLTFRGSPASVASTVVDAIATIAQATPQDVSGRANRDPAETRLDPPYTTAHFIRAIRPDHALPPNGVARMDLTTFYDATPSTVVTFDVTFYNDFHHNTTGAVQLFRATIVVVGRAGTVLDTRRVFIVVPTDADAVPPE